MSSSRGPPPSTLFLARALIARSLPYNLCYRFVCTNYLLIVVDLIIVMFSFTKRNKGATKGRGLAAGTVKYSTLVSIYKYYKTQVHFHNLLTYGHQHNIHFRISRRQQRGVLFFQGRICFLFVF